jgi:hypothetical protein
VLDYYGNLFCSKYLVPDESLQWVPARNAYHFTETGSHPCVLHFPGETKHLLPKFTQALKPLDTTMPEFSMLAGVAPDGEGGVEYVHQVPSGRGYVAHPMLDSRRRRRNE